jgi:hypothetical protein
VSSGSSSHTELTPAAVSVLNVEATGEFTVDSFTPVPAPESSIVTGTPVGLATMVKQFEGEIAGTAATLFTSAYDEAAGIGTYLAMESFEGRLHDRAGTFNFVHSATTTGSDRQHDFFLIVPGSGTGELAGIAGSGALVIDADGTHHIDLDYSFE